MNREPFASDDRMLEALVVGDLEEHDPEVAARLSADPALARRWQELRTTVRALEVLSPKDLADLPHEAVPAVEVGDLLAGRRSAARPLRWFLMVAAAALVLGLVLILRTRPDGQPGMQDPWLGGTPPGAGTTTGLEWPRDQPLRWQPVNGAESYRLELEPLPAGPVLRVPGPGFGPAALETAEWLPTAAEQAVLPAHFRWRVLAVDASNRILTTSAWTETRR